MVVHPAWNRVADLVRENISAAIAAGLRFSGRKLSAICRQARLELLDAARRWTAAYRDVGPTPENPSGLDISRRTSAADVSSRRVAKEFRLGTPGGTTSGNGNQSDRRQRRDIEHIAARAGRIGRKSFGRRDCPLIGRIRPYHTKNAASKIVRCSIPSAGAWWNRLSNLIPHPLDRKILADGDSPIARDRPAGSMYCPGKASCRDGVGTDDAGNSSKLGVRFGLLSLARGPFAGAIAEVFRRLQRSRPRVSPFVSHSQRIASRARSGGRGRMAGSAVLDLVRRKSPAKTIVRQTRTAVKLLLTDRQDINARLSLTDQGDAGRAVEQLAELARRGVKIRSRALVTTLWARLVLGDLFIHGIGGGNYDLVTDRIIERFFHRKPPGFMILSATLHLPITVPSPTDRGVGRGRVRDQIPSPISAKGAKAVRAQPSTVNCAN